MRKLKRRRREKGPLSVTEKGKEGKSKMIASCGFLEDELRQCSKEEGVTMADSVETLGVDLRTRVKSWGVKEKARRRKCKVRFSLIKKNKGFPKEPHEVWCQDGTSGKGLIDIGIHPENWCWKDVGFRKDSSVLIGQMKVSAKHVTKRKAPEKHRFYHCPEWNEVRREISEAFRKWEQNARTSKKEWKWAKWYCHASTR